MYTNLINRLSVATFILMLLTFTPIFICFCVPSLFAEYSGIVARLFVFGTFVILALVVLINVLKSKNY